MSQYTQEKNLLWKQISTTVVCLFFIVIGIYYLVSTSNTRPWEWWVLLAISCPLLVLGCLSTCRETTTKEKKQYATMTDESKITGELLY